MHRKMGEKGKAQSAMEYLMTYGWAILIIAVIVATLFSLGIFSSNNGPRAPPGSCIVLRTVTAVSLQGECQGQLPEFAGEFPGTGTISVQDSSIFNPTTEMTITAWVNLAGAVGNWASINTKTHGAQRSWWFGVWPSSYDNILWSVNGDNSCTLPTAPLKAWAFIAVTYSSTSGKVFYENGQLISSCSVSMTGTIPVTSSTVYLVGDPSWATLNGQAANEQVYNTSLSANEVQALYLEGIGGAPIKLQNLVAWWPLNGDARDYSGNGNDGQISGGVSFNSTWNSQYTPP